MKVLISQRCMFIFLPVNIFQAEIMLRCPTSASFLTGNIRKKNKNVFKLEIPISRKGGGGLRKTYIFIQYPFIKLITINTFIFFGYYYFLYTAVILTKIFGPYLSYLQAYEFRLLLLFFLNCSTR